MNWSQKWWFVCEGPRSLTTRITWMGQLCVEYQKDCAFCDKAYLVHTAYGECQHEIVVNLETVPYTNVAVLILNMRKYRFEKKVIKHGENNYNVNINRYFKVIHYP